LILQNWWLTTLLPHSYPAIKSLKKDIQVDVLIIGGGMTGISAAAAFIGKGRKVALIERNILGGSSTGRSAGFLTPDSELELNQLERRFGKKGAMMLWNVPLAGTNIIVKNIGKYEINCDLIKQDSLFLGLGNSGLKQIELEKQARAKINLESEVYDAQGVKKILGSNAFSSAVRYSGTYGISALQYVQGMKKVLLDAGVEIYEATEARKIIGHDVYTHEAKISADQIIVAMDKLEPSFSKFAKEVYHAQTFLCVSEPLSHSEQKNLFPTGKQFQCWDSSLVYSYWRLTGAGRLLLGGGSAVTTFMTHPYNSDRVIKSVIRDFKRRFPALKNLHFVQYWPGLIDTTRDLLPTIVRDAEAPHVHYAFGIVGLPWASFCGDFLGRVLLGEAHSDEMKYFSYFSDRRYFFLPSSLQKIIGKPLLFSFNNAWAKYEQVDVNHKLDFLETDF
jgi:gamma-glutamylputrescine oxidase